MTKEKVFRILNIEETQDKAIIKNAYREKLLTTHPEDNPEEFKELREAYEEALILADKIEISSEVETPVTQWIKQVEAAYKNINLRIDVHNWKNLFLQDVCNDFDTEEELKEAFLIFLMDHYRLPKEVWEVIEEKFEFSTSKDELYEKFPSNFVDFITENHENKKWMNYNLFEGDENEKIDEFIENYLSLRQTIDVEDWSSFEDTLNKIVTFKIWHPYFEVEKMRYYLEKNKIEDAKDSLELLKSKDYTDLYIKYYIAWASLKTGDFKKAYSASLDILEIVPEHFGAKHVMAMYYFEKKEYELSKKYYMDLLEIDTHDEKLMKEFQASNEEVIKIYQHKIKENPENNKLKIELGWCLWQGEFCEESINLVEPLKINEEDVYDYYNLLSRAYFYSSNYEKAELYSKKWLEEILKVKDDGTEESQKKIKRLPHAYYLISKCYYNFALEKDKHYFELCIENLDNALAAEVIEFEKLRYLLDKAEVYIKIEEYEKAIDACDEIIKRNTSYYPAYVYRQEACFNLKMAQEVIDDFYRAVEIYAGEAKPYLFALKVFMIYDKYEDASYIINRAKEAEIKSNEIEFNEIIIKKIQAEEVEEKKAVVDELINFYDKAGNEIGDLEDLSEVLYQLALCYYNLDEDNLALETINKKLDMNTTGSALVLKGDILYYSKEYEEALKVYLGIIERYPDYIYGYYQIAQCYKFLDDEESSVAYYSKVLEMDENHQYANNDLMNIFQNRYCETHEKTDYLTAVGYGQRQIELMPMCYYYNELGLLYLDGYDLEKAVETFEKAVDDDATDMYAYNNLGFTHKILGHYEEAYKNYQFALNNKQNDDMIAVGNLAAYYLIMGKYEESIKAYGELLITSNNPIDVKEKLVSVYIAMKAWDEAIYWTEDIYEIDVNKKKTGKNIIKQIIALRKKSDSWKTAFEAHREKTKRIKESKIDYLIEVGNIYVYSGNYEEAEKYYTESVKNYPNDKRAYSSMGDYLLYILNQPEKALNYYKKACKLAESTDGEGEIDYQMLEPIILILNLLGKNEECIVYYNQLISIIEKNYISIEKWLDEPEYRKVRLFNMAAWNYQIGEYENSKHYMKLMKESYNCRACKKYFCFEYLILEGMMSELEQDYEGALEKYTRALDAAPDDIETIGKIRILKMKMEVKNK